MTDRLTEDSQRTMNDSISAAMSSKTVLKEGLGERIVACAEHGNYASSGVRYFKKIEVWTKCPDCEEALRAAARQTEAREQAEREQARLEALLGQAAIPKRFIGRSLENFVATTGEQKHAHSVSCEFVMNYRAHAERGDGLIYSGMPGTGKSHLATAIQQALLPDVNSLYITCAGLIRAVRATWSRGSEWTEVEVLREFSTVDLLVIDEVGATGGTDNEQALIFDILDRRYRDMKSTILLTNQDKAGFKSFVGDRVFDRFTETARWVPFGWASYRPTARNGLPINDPQFERNLNDVSY